ncbi:MAG: M14 family metallopeptidase [Gammaproteobacteria bacterium]|nr:M14 family metallopeptidase [Gammaproteobacteria bacterium]MBU1725032.1 M14 family metallopeptidase [Gammaproteobacteria bacterium]MBU2005101.1 M14 family metallopeptidase [Gammaproteobacteria bacterium]
MFDPLVSPALQQYPADYCQARSNLLNAMEKQTCLLEHEAIRHDAKGALGEPLFTDILWLGRNDAENVLVLISATHGVEGFAGSAIQHDVLLQLARTALPDNLAVVIIHALNPWGFSHLRRVNEKGIDLNRNSVDFQQVLPESADYNLLAGSILPTDGNWQAADQQLLLHAAQWGEQRFRRAITSGQYTHPAGLFYGGDAPAFSRQLIERKLGGWQLDQRQVLVLDLHTGLGPFGHGELVCDHPADSLASHKARQWFNRLVSLPETGNSCSIPLVGLMDYLWHSAMREDGIYLTLEYGTYPVLRMLEVLRRDHWLYAQGVPDFCDPQAQAIRAELREFFDPDSTLWRESVLLRARQVIRTGWQRLLGVDSGA